MATYANRKLHLHVGVRVVVKSDSYTVIGVCTLWTVWWVSVGIGREVEWSCRSSFRGRSVPSFPPTTSSVVVCGCVYVCVCVCVCMCVCTLKACAHVMYVQCVCLNYICHAPPPALWGPQEREAATATRGTHHWRWLRDGWWNSWACPLSGTYVNRTSSTVLHCVDMECVCIYMKLWMAFIA